MNLACILHSVQFVLIALAYPSHVWYYCRWTWSLHS